MTKNKNQINKIKSEIVLQIKGISVPKWFLVIALQELLQNPLKIAQFWSLVVNIPKNDLNPVFNRTWKRPQNQPRMLHTGRVDAKAKSTRGVCSAHGACGLQDQFYTGRVQPPGSKTWFFAFSSFLDRLLRNFVPSFIIIPHEDPNLQMHLKSTNKRANKSIPTTNP